MRRTGLLLLAVCAIASCSSSSSSPRAGKYSQADVEYKLAAIAGETLTESNVAKYDEALDADELACRETRERIGDMIVAGEEDLAAKGSSVSYLELLREVSASVPEAMRPTPCASIIAALVTLTG